MQGSIPAGPSRIGTTMTIKTGISLEEDLLCNEYMLTKVRCNESYAQNLYAALCNNEFMLYDVVTILKDERWFCSWRHAGGIIADMIGEGDYMNWYCSGIKADIVEREDGWYFEYYSPILVGAKPNTTEITYSKIPEEKLAYCKAVVTEGTVTDEVRADLFKMGWVVCKGL